MRPYIKALQESIRPKEPALVQIEKRKPYTQDDIDRIRRELDKETIAILQYLKKHPFKNETEIGKATKAGQKKARVSLEELNSLGLILELEIFTSTMPRKTLLYANGGARINHAKIPCRTFRERHRRDVPPDRQ
jgi:hypothetical protein